MKKQFLFLSNAILTLGIGNAMAQNIVPNPSFENYSICPSKYGELYKCLDWSTYGHSPDYFNACSPDTVVNVPKNNFGFQYAATGSAYCGFINASGGPAPPQEFLGAALIQPLVMGQKYFASFKISFASFYCATNKMGIGLSTVPFDSLNPPPLNNNAFVYSDSVINDTSNWYLIKGSFIADSNYSYIIIGNLFTNVSSCAAGTYISYYYVDDVCLSVDSATCYGAVGIAEIKKSETIKVYPNPFLNNLNIHVDDPGLSEIILYDITSRIVLKKYFETSISFNTLQLAKGIYAYEVRNNKGSMKRGLIAKN